MSFNSTDSFDPFLNLLCWLMVCILGRKTVTSITVPMITSEIAVEASCKMSS